MVFFKRNILCLLVLFSVGCQNIERLHDIYSYEVPAEVDPLVHRFENEARKYAIDIEVKNLIVKYKRDLPQGIRAQVWQEKGQKYIYIDETFRCWAGSGETFARYREILIFHELGHLYLGRPHTEGRDEKSLLQFSLMSSSSECGGFHHYISNIDRREYYIQELFTGERDLQKLRLF